jgi:hypothetical protein
MKVKLQVSYSYHNNSILIAYDNISILRVES